MNKPEAKSLAITTPLIDTLCIGGLSIVLFAFFLSYQIGVSGQVVVERFIILTVLLNAPHFMASYRLLYHNKEMVQRYRAASTYVPILLIAYGIWAGTTIVLDPQNTFWIQWLLIAVGIYLALHYTGQVWGMMATFSYMEKAPFDDQEKALFRWIIKLLCLWQIIWTIRVVEPPLDWALPYLSLGLTIGDLLYFAALPLAIFGFIKYSNRIGKFPPARVWIPMVAIFLWYAALRDTPAMLFWVQMSHALQYLIFPYRVEINRQSPDVASDKSNLFRHLLGYSTVLFASGYLVFVGFGQAISYGNEGFQVYALIFTSLINIHHFYIDGAVWKISNPTVRAELFSHISPPSKS